MMSFNQIFSIFVFLYFEMVRGFNNQTEYGVYGDDARIKPCGINAISVDDDAPLAGCLDI